MVDGGYLVDGVDVSALAAEVAVPRAAGLVEATQTGEADAFEVALGRMVDGCNACHRRSGYREIQIVPPAGAAYPSQDFTPIPTPTR